MTSSKKEPKRLFRSKENRIIAGILGGIGEYLDVDPVVVRAVYVLLGAVTGFLPFVIAYIALLFIIPEKE